MSKINYAKRFLENGISVIPLRHRGKEPESAMMGGTWERYKTELPTEYQVACWLASGWQNYGVVAGWDNLAMIDFDNADAFQLWQTYYEQQLVRIYELKTPPFIVKSARGAHVYIRLYGTEANQKRQGVDVKVHGYVVGPESIHPSGAVYTAQGDDFNFPQVFHLDTWLPAELFPHVAPSASVGHLEALQMTFDKPSQGVYDPFAVASGQGGAGIDLLSTVKASVRIENMFPDAIKTSADGRWLAARCIFHDDKKPSFWIDTRRQLCGCQVCGMKPMDAINLYARMHNMSDRDAVSAMAQEVGVWG